MLFVREKLDFLYSCFLVLGILVPVITLLAGGVGDALDFDLDADAGPDIPLPINLTCVFCGLAVTGLTGKRLNGGTAPLPALALALACGIAAYAVLYRFVIRPLKRNDAAALRLEDMVGASGVVTTAIPYRGIGEARFQDKLGSPISYTVRYNDTDFQREAVPAGSRVSVVGVEGTVLVVCRIPSEP